MRLLLDSHAFLWWLNDDRKLSSTARAAIESPRSVVHVSAATIWEISIKAQLGRLELRKANLVAEIAANQFVELSISAVHAQFAAALPNHHHDPFDRMLVAQADIEKLTLVTHDHKLRAYQVALLET